MEKEFNLGTELDKMLDYDYDNLTEEKLKKKVKEITKSFNKSSAIIKNLD